MKRFLLSILIVVLSVSVCHDRLWKLSTTLVYDDVSDITWMVDANYPATSEYPQSNITNPSSIGQMSYEDAIAWAAQLNYGGYADWRLPEAAEIAGTEPTAGYGAYGEFGKLFYTNLGNTKTSGLKNISVVGGYGNTITFINIQQGVYWTRTQDLTHDENSWTFNWDNGTADKSTAEANNRWAWAVRGGGLTQNYLQFNGETVTFDGEGVVF